MCYPGNAEPRNGATSWAAVRAEIWHPQFSFIERVKGDIALVQFLATSTLERRLRHEDRLRTRSKCRGEIHCRANTRKAQEHRATTAQRDKAEGMSASCAKGSSTSQASVGFFQCVWRIQKALGLWALARVIIGDSKPCKGPPRCLRSYWSIALPSQHGVNLVSPCV